MYFQGKVLLRNKLVKNNVFYPSKFLPYYEYYSLIEAIFVTERLLQATGYELRVTSYGVAELRICYSPDDTVEGPC